MPTPIGPTNQRITLVGLDETADIQVAIKQAVYGNSSGSSVSPDSIYASVPTKVQAATNSATTFTGTVVLPSTTSIAKSDGSGTLISATELSYLDGVTSNIQTQINSMINESSFWFGDGSDGTIVINASTAGYSGWATKSGSVYTLTRDVFFINLTVDNTFTIDPNGFRIFATGTVTLSGTNAITHTPVNGSNGTNGSAGVRGTGGAGGTATANLSSYYGNISSGTSGGSGGLNQIGSGGNGVAGIASSTVTTYPTWSKIYTPSRGATGNSNAGGATGGAGGASASQSVGISWRRAFVDWTSPFLAGVPVSGAGGTGGGGSAGTSSTYGAGGGGGGSGNTGVFLFAKTISIAAANDVIKFIGGNGGNGGSTADNNGGAGAGGQGGFVYLVYTSITGGISSTQINVSGGNGGSTVAAPGGYSGVVCFVNLSNGTISANTPIAPSGSTGGSYAIPRP